MAEQEEEYEGNGKVYVSSPRQHNGSHGEPDNHDDFKSKESEDYDRETSRSRDKEKERSRDRDRKKDKEKDGGRDKDRDREKEKVRDKDRHREETDRDRDRDRERDHHKDRHRDRRERIRDIDDDDHYKRRRRDYDEDREDRYRRSSRSHHRSRSPSRTRSHHRSRSQSGSPSRPRSLSKSKRISGFDMAPPAGAIVPGVAPASAVIGNLYCTRKNRCSGATAAIPGMLPNMFPLAGQIGTLSAMPVHAMTQQATRHARRVYVGGLPPTANEQSVAIYFSQVMTAVGGNTAGPGDAVVNVYINYEKKFAFVEMRSVEEASNAMALDDIIFEGTSVKVRRPSDYNPSLAATLGPSQPSPHLNLAAVGLSPGTTGGLEGPDRIFVGGVPYYFTEAQVRELLESFGPLKGFDLVKDRDTGNSKGYAFCVYKDVSVTDIVCQALNGIKMGDRTLTVRRANQGASQPKPEQESILLHAQQQIALQKMMLQPPPPTKVVCLTHCVVEEDLKDDSEYEDIIEDMRDEGGKFGSLVNVVIPRPSPNGEPTPGLGKVFLEYADVESASRARSGMNGRKFGGNQVIAVYYPENKFAQSEYDG